MATKFRVARVSADNSAPLFRVSHVEVAAADPPAPHTKFRISRIVAEVTFDAPVRVFTGGVWVDADVVAYRSGVWVT